MKNNFQEIAVKIFFAIIGFFALIFLLKFLSRIMFIHLFYGPMLGFLTGIFGGATGVMKITAVVGSVLLAMAIPTIIAVIAFGKKRKETFVVLSIAFVILCGFLFYESQTSFFDSESGEPTKYYCITVDGVKFSSNPGMHTASGNKFIPITKELMEKYTIWQKHEQGEKAIYFDTLTGKPNFKYGQSAEGKITLYSTLYEFNPVTGEKLQFITKKIAEEHKKQIVKELAFGATPEPAPQPPQQQWKWSTSSQKTLGPGKHHFVLSPGEQTPWIKVPVGIYDIYLSDGEGDFSVYYNDGTHIRFNDRESKKLPKKQNVKFKITSEGVKKQHFTVTAMPR